jgi:hypothetical protein
MHPLGSETDLIKAVNAIENRLKEKFPEVLWSFFEPDISD